MESQPEDGQSGDEPVEDPPADAGSTANTVTTAKADSVVQADRIRDVHVYGGQGTAESIDAHRQVVAAKDEVIEMQRELIALNQQLAQAHRQLAESVSARAETSNMVFVLQMVLMRLTSLIDQLTRERDFYLGQAARQQAELHRTNQRLARASSDQTRTERQLEQANEEHRRSTTLAVAATLKVRELEAVLASRTGVIADGGTIDGSALDLPPVDLDAALEDASTTLDRMQDLLNEQDQRITGLEVSLNQEPDPVDVPDGQSFHAAVPQRPEVEQRADQAAGWAQQLRRHDLELALAVSKAAVYELAPTDAAVLTRWGFLAKPTIDRLALGHTAAIASMVWLPDGQGLMSVSLDGSICVWSSRGLLLSQRFLPVDAIEAAWLSPDGDHVAVRIRDRGVELWSTDGSGSGVRLTAQPYVRLFNWLGVGERVASVVKSSEITVWDVDLVAQGVLSECQSILTPAISSLAWSPDGTRFAFATSSAVGVLSAVDVDEVLALVANVRDSSVVLSWSSDGRRIAIFVKSNGSAPRWGERQPELANVSVFDASAGLLVNSWVLGDIGGIELSPNGEFLAVSCVDPQGQAFERVLEIRGVESGGVVWKRRVGSSSIDLLSWSADGQSLAYAERYSGKVSFWDLCEGEAWGGVGGRLEGLSWSSGKSLAAAAFSMNWYPYMVGRSASNIVVGTREGDWGLSCASWSPRERLVAYADNVSVEVWNPRLDRRIARFDGLSSRVECLAWSMDEQYLACVGSGLYDHDRNEVHVWRSGESWVGVEMGSGGKCQPVLAWSPDSGLLAGVGSDGDIIAWRVQNGRVEFTIETGAEKIHSLCWSPDGMFIMGATGDFQLRLWEVFGRRLIAACVGHEKRVVDVDWSPDGRYVASVGEDKSVRLWDPLTGFPLAVLEVSFKPLNLRWSSDSSKLTLVSSDNAIIVWTLPSGVDDLAELEGGVETRVLTAGERQRFALPPAPVARPEGH